MKSFNCNPTSNCGYVTPNSTRKPTKKKFQKRLREKNSLEIEREKMLSQSAFFCFNNVALFLII